MYISYLITFICTDDFYSLLLIQAPESMKSVLQAAWLLNVAFGNIIVIIVAEAKAFDSQVSILICIYCFTDLWPFPLLAQLINDKIYT